MDKEHTVQETEVYRTDSQKMLLRELGDGTWCIDVYHYQHCEGVLHLGRAQAEALRDSLNAMLAP